VIVDTVHDMKERDLFPGLEGEYFFNLTESVKPVKKCQDHLQMLLQMDSIPKYQSTQENLSIQIKETLDYFKVSHEILGSSKIEQSMSIVKLKEENARLSTELSLTQQKYKKLKEKCLEYKEKLTANLQNPDIDNPSQSNLAQVPK
jgi:ABC-type nitrate/sulfonate/bicarbonate transport system ATPase subunit